MPYGIDKHLGGDSKENDAWMERCVTSVQKGGKSKSSAIAICKTQMRKKKTEDSSVDAEILHVEQLLKSNYVAKQMTKGFTFEQAEANYEAFLAKLDFDLELVVKT